MFKKIAIVVVVLLIIIFGIKWLWSLLLDGRLVITTNDKNNFISLIQLPAESSQNNKSISQSIGKLDVRLAPGEYLAKVSTKTLISQQIVNVRRRNTSAYQINLKPLVEPVPVITSPARDMAADAIQLEFLDVSNSNITQIDANNNINIKFSSAAFRSVKWADTSFGVGQLENGGLVVINGNSLSNLQIPENAAGQGIDYAVAQNHQIFVVVGKVLYKETPTGLAKIYTSESPPDDILASNVSAVLINNASSGKGLGKPQVVLIGSDGQVHKKTGAYSSVAISPSGKYLSIGNVSDNQLFDSSFSGIGIIPAGSVLKPFWLDDNRLVYNDSGGIWIYSRPEQKTELLSAISGSGSASEIAPSREGSYIYFTAGTGDNSQDLTVSRISLNGQQESKSAYQLGVLLPANFPSYKLDYVNFTKPTVYVKPTSYSPGTDYALQATISLQNYGLDTRQVDIRVLPPSSE